MCECLCDAFLVRIAVVCKVAECTCCSIALLVGASRQQPNELSDTTGLHDCLAVLLTSVPACANAYAYAYVRARTRTCVRAKHVCMRTRDARVSAHKACVRASERASVRASERACVRARHVYVERIECNARRSVTIRARRGAERCSAVPVQSGVVRSYDRLANASTADSLPRLGPLRMCSTRAAAMA